MCCGHGLFGGTEVLSLPNHVQGLNVGDQFLGTPKRFEPKNRIYDAFDLPMVLLDNVVEVLRLAQFNVQAGIGVDTLNSSGVGATFCRPLGCRVDGSTKTPRSRIISSRWRGLGVLSKLNVLRECDLVL